MPPLITFTGPIPRYAGQQFCTLCAASWKAAALAAMDGQIRAAGRETEPQRLHLDVEDQLDPDLAVATGLAVLPVPPNVGQGVTMAPVPLCWSHLMAVNLIESSLQPATPGQLPGGAVDLSARRG